MAQINTVMNKSCSIAIAQSFMEKDLYLVWGGLDDNETEWTDAPPTIDPTKTRFDNEICRRLIVTKKYVKQDPSGNIESGGYRWIESDTPTECLLLSVTHNQADASSSTIYKVGVAAGTKLTSEVTDKSFVNPLQLTDSGYLICSANIPKLVRDPTVAQKRDFILRF